jgi:hypothetical protein
MPDRFKPGDFVAVRYLDMGEYVFGYVQSRRNEGAQYYVLRADIYGPRRYRMPDLLQHAHDWYVASWAMCHAVWTFLGPAAMPFPLGIPPAPHRKQFYP